MSTKPLEQVVMKVGSRGKNYVRKSILLDDEFYIQFEFDHLSAITSNSIKLNHKMAFYKEEEGNQVKIQRILVVDILQYIKQARIIKSMKGSAWLTLNGISPLGDVKNFVYEDQASSTENKSGRGTNNYHSIISKIAVCPEQMLEDISNHKSIRKVDVVIIKNPAKPDPFWKRGRVIKLSRDNRVLQLGLKEEIA